MPTSPLTVEGVFQDVANAIRAKGHTTASIYPKDLADKVNGLRVVDYRTMGEPEATTNEVTDETKFVLTFPFHSTYTNSCPYLVFFSFFLNEDISFVSIESIKNTVEYRKPIIIGGTFSSMLYEDGTIDIGQFSFKPWYLRKATQSAEVMLDFEHFITPLKPFIKDTSTPDKVVYKSSDFPSTMTSVSSKIEMSCGMNEGSKNMGYFRLELPENATNPSGGLIDLPRFATGFKYRVWSTVLGYVNANVMPDQRTS